MCIIKTNSSLLCHIFTLLALLWGIVVNFCVAFLASIGQRRLISRHWSFGPLPVVKSIYELVPVAQHVQHSGCTRDTFSLDFIAHPFAHDSRWNHPALVVFGGAVKGEDDRKKTPPPGIGLQLFRHLFSPSVFPPAHCVLHYFQFHLRALRAQPCSKRDHGKRQEGTAVRYDAPVVGFLLNVSPPTAAWDLGPERNSEQWLGSLFGIFMKSNNLRIARRKSLLNVCVFECGR